MKAMSSRRRERLGRLLILVGVATWLPYGVVKYGMGQEVAMYPFLAVHLLGVIPGFILRREALLRRLFSRLRQ